MNTRMEKKDIIQQCIHQLSGFITKRRWKRMIEVANERTRYLIPVLEDFYQSHNASAVMRTCECLGIQQLRTIEKTNVFQHHPDISIGSERWIEVIRYKSNAYKNPTVSCLNDLKNEGYLIAVLTPHGKTIELDDFPVESTKTALVLGKEKEGVSAEAMQMADVFIKIPMYGFTESFNVSVTAAVCLYQMRRRLERSNQAYKLTEEEKAKLLLGWLLRDVKNARDILAKEFPEIDINQLIY